MLNQKKQDQFSDPDKNQNSFPLNGQEVVDKFLNKPVAGSIHNRSSKWFHCSPVNRTQEESKGDNNKDENQPSLKPVS